MVVGRAPAGFVEAGSPVLKRGVQYGFGINGIGPGRVDFVFGESTRQIRNITEKAQLISLKCGMYARCWQDKLNDKQPEMVTGEAADPQAGEEDQ